MIKKNIPDDLKTVEDFLLQQLGLTCTSYTKDPECEEYTGYTCTLASLVFIYRKAKITPKKIGQFVTTWKRNEARLTAPFSNTDSIDFFLIMVEDQNRLGYFIFPKSVLAKQGILTTPKKEGKRGFRVYPDWDTPTSKQAIQTQQWQSLYFIHLTQDLPQAIEKASKLLDLKI